MHLIIQRLIDHSSVFDCHFSRLNLGAAHPCQGVLHEFFVITIWKVLMSVSTTRFLPGLGSIHFLTRLIDQILELNCFDEICVPHHTSICDTDIRVFFHNHLNFLFADGKILCIPINWSISLHHSLQFPPQHG